MHITFGIYTYIVLLLYVDVRMYVCMYVHYYVGKIYLVIATSTAGPNCAV